MSRGLASAGTVACLMLVSACSGGKDAPSRSGPLTLWASGGFACLEQDHWFDCRLLDDYIQNHGQAEIPNERLAGISFGSDDVCTVNLEGDGVCTGGNVNHNDEIPPGPWTMVSQGEGQACGLHTDGSVECWGNGVGGAIPPSGPFVEVRSIDQGACARTDAGAITCWGYNYQGNVASPAGTWASFIFPNSYLCMLDGAGSITCTGLAVVSAAAIPSGGGYRSLTGGFGFACALNRDDRAMCWGDAAAGQLAAPDDEFEQIVSGQYFTCGLRKDGTVTCWGCRGDSTSNPDQYCNWDSPAPWWEP